MLYLGWVLYTCALFFSRRVYWMTEISLLRRMDVLQSTTASVV